MDVSAIKKREQMLIGGLREALQEVWQAVLV